MKLFTEEQAFEDFSFISSLPPNVRDIWYKNVVSTSNVHRWAMHLAKKGYLEKVSVVVACNPPNRSRFTIDYRVTEKGKSYLRLKEL
jgi:hypothetical protein